MLRTGNSSGFKFLPMFLLRVDGDASLYKLPAWSDVQGWTGLTVLNSPCHKAVACAAVHTSWALVDTCDDSKL